jgi:hypothetical protein
MLFSGFGKHFVTSSKLIKEVTVDEFLDTLKQISIPL